jgi:hypothetical protein
MASAFHDLRPEQVPKAVTQSFPNVAGQTAVRAYQKLVGCNLRLALISRFFLRNFGPFWRKKIFAKFSEIQPLFHGFNEILKKFF